MLLHKNLERKMARI